LTCVPTLSALTIAPILLWAIAGDMADFTTSEARTFPHCFFVLLGT
jgi:hypothetical protein